MSFASAFPRALAHFRALPCISKISSSTVVLDPQEMNEKIHRTLPVPATDQEVFEYEYRLNCLEYATLNCDKLECCFIEVGNRQIVARFVSTCQSAATCDLWTRITTLCDALDNALLQVNDATDGKYRELEHCIFSRAATDAQPPKKHKHRAYVRLGRDPDFMRISLTDQMDDIYSMAMNLLEYLVD